MTSLISLMTLSTLDHLILNKWNLSLDDKMKGLHLDIVLLRENYLIKKNYFSYYDLY